MIAQGLHLDPKEVRERLHKFAGTPQYQPIYLKEDITPDELAFIESHHNELPELDTIVAHRRLYPRNGFMAHLVGYVGEVSEQMLNQPRWRAHNPGDVVGRSGVELEYNEILMGKNGSRQVLVNSKTSLYCSSTPDLPTTSPGCKTPARLVQHLFADFTHVPHEVRHEPVARVQPPVRHDISSSGNSLRWDSINASSSGVMSSLR